MYKLVIEITKLFDYKDKNESLNNLIKDCKENIEYFNIDSFELNHFEKFNDRKAIIIRYIFLCLKVMIYCIFGISDSMF